MQRSFSLILMIYYGLLTANYDKFLSLSAFIPQDEREGFSRYVFYKSAGELIEHEASGDFSIFLFVVDNEPISLTTKSDGLKADGRDFKDDKVEITVSDDIEITSIKFNEKELKGEDAELFTRLVRSFSDLFA